MKKVLMTIILSMAMVIMAPAAEAVTKAEDIATTIMLRGYACPGRTVTNISESEDGQGQKTIRATCTDGARYQIDISATGRVSVRRIN